MVTDSIIAELQSGRIPWRKPWASAYAPQNLMTRRSYRGINAILLNNLGFEQPFFLGFNQVKELGGSVIKGEKSAPAIYLKQAQATEEQAEPRWELRSYGVFNVQQCKDIPACIIPPIESGTQRLTAAAKRIVKGMPNPPSVNTVREQMASYIPLMDCVKIAAAKQFVQPDYYLTLFQQLIHSTGHNSRLNRPEVMDNPSFAVQKFSLEALTAEMGTCMLASAADIEDMYIEDMGEYISKLAGSVPKRQIHGAEGKPTGAESSRFHPQPAIYSRRRGTGCQWGSC